MTVGERIAFLRTQKDMTQRQLAKKLSLSPSAIGMYEQGRRQPSGELIVALSRIFSVSADYLLTGKPYSEKDFRADLSMLFAAQGK